MSTPSEPLVFQQTVEGLLRALGPEHMPAVAAQLRAIGVDPERLLPAYPLPTWVAAMEVSASVLSPGTSREQAMYVLGRRFMDGFGSTLLGKALLSLMRVLGPERTLQRMTRNFHSANNYTRTQLQALGPGHFSVWCSQVSYPDYYRGLLEVGLRRAGAQGVSVELADRKEGGATFHVRWR